jgi:bisphosphoglycerate-dependent phosphoglycerate mutase
MKTNAGVWIDHREAIIVTLSETGEEIKRIPSAVEKHRRSNEPSNGQVPPDDQLQNAFTEHLAHWYDVIISYLRNADSILIFGPGEAKGELMKRLEKTKDDQRTLAMETSDNMTEPQLAAMVRHHFHLDASRRANKLRGQENI